MSCDSLSPNLTMTTSVLLETGRISRLQLLSRSSQSRFASGFADIVVTVVTSKMNSIDVHIRSNFSLAKHSRRLQTVAKIPSANYDNTKFLLRRELTLRFCLGWATKANFRGATIFLTDEHCGVCRIFTRIRIILAAFVCSTLTHSQLTLCSLIFSLSLTPLQIGYAGCSACFTPKTIFWGQLRACSWSPNIPAHERWSQLAKDEKNDDVFQHAECSKKKAQKRSNVRFFGQIIYVFAKEFHPVFAAMLPASFFFPHLFFSAFLGKTRDDRGRVCGGQLQGWSWRRGGGVVNDTESKSWDAGSRQ